LIIFRASDTPFSALIIIFHYCSMTPPADAMITHRQLILFSPMRHYCHADYFS